MLIQASALIGRQTHSDASISKGSEAIHRRRPYRLVAALRERYFMSRNKDVFEFAEGKDIAIESEVERSTKWHSSR